MGILVTGNLPSGILVSNVYISFNEEPIYVSPTDTGMYRINSTYKVFTDPTKTQGSNIRIPITIQLNDISPGIYSLLYEELKSIYPNNVDSQ